MNSIALYLVEMNITLLILYTAYKLIFEKDRNFVIRRIYLLGVILLPVLLPFIPQALRSPVSNLAPFSFSLEEITFTAEGNPAFANGRIQAWKILMYIYISVMGIGIAKLFIQLIHMTGVIIKSDRVVVKGTTILLNPAFHASSFFGYIFMDPDALRGSSFKHILDHEKVHKRDWHSLDRILAELFVMINWFNPVVWLIRKSVIENLEYMADSSVVGRGTDPVKYQLSILNQYIGSASLTNQFSSQIKNRINMLNRDYKLGSSWKIVLVFPLICIALIAISCADKEPDAPGEEKGIIASDTSHKIYYEVDEMPTLNGEDPVMPFRKFIAENLVYPEKAKENGVTGKIIVKFVVRKDGTVQLPSKEEIATLEGLPIGEVVVVGYRSIDENKGAPREEYIELLKEEAIRVVTSSPRWEPGKVDGKPVDVMYTFPINFVLQ